MGTPRCIERPVPLIDADVAVRDPVIKGRDETQSELVMDWHRASHPMPFGASVTPSGTASSV